MKNLKIKPLQKRHMNITCVSRVIIRVHVLNLCKNLCNLITFLCESHLNSRVKTHRMRRATCCICEPTGFTRDPMGFTWEFTWDSPIMFHKYTFHMWSLLLQMWVLCVFSVRERSVRQSSHFFKDSVIIWDKVRTAVNPDNQLVKECTEAETDLHFRLN